MQRRNKKNKTLKKYNINFAPLLLCVRIFYLVYTLIRGTIVSFYPYPLVNVNNLGYQKNLINSGLLVLFHHRSDIVHQTLQSGIGFLSSFQFLFN